MLVLINKEELIVALQLNRKERVKEREEKSKAKRGSREYVSIRRKRNAASLETREKKRVDT